MNIRRGAAAVAAAASLALVMGLVSAGSAQAAVTATPGPTRVDLKLLVLDDGSEGMLSIKAELDREGIPYTDLVGSGTWGGITAANYLSQTITTTDVPAQSIIEAHYEGVILPDRQTVGAASPAALTALDAYELQFGIRELATYAYPSGSNYGLAATSGTLDGLTTSLTSAAKAPATLNVPAGPFAYLNGSPTFDNNSTTVDEVYGYSVSTPASATWTPMVNVAAGGTVSAGAVVGVQTDASGRERMLVTADSNTGQYWMDILSRGAVAWVTRGVSLGYERNYLSVQLDDLFLGDDRWNAAAQCTYTGASGSSCPVPTGEGYTAQNSTINMTAGDVTSLASWEASHIHLGFAFNGSGAADNTALLDAIKANLASFYFINHTWDHEYLGCLQNAPSETVAWLCYSNSNNYPATVPATSDPNAADYSWYPENAATLHGISYTGIIPEINLNKTWAAANLGSSWNPSELITGEHSGLTDAPQSGVDNPVLPDALTQTGISVLASDASREASSRTVGSAVTVPRHPMDIYYNTSTYLEAASEYSKIYPTAPVTFDNVTDATNSFNNYIVPTVSRIALGSVYTNDPRPFYAHQSNVTGDKVLLPVLDSMLSQHAALFISPTVQTTLTQQAKILGTQGTWAADRNSLTALTTSTPYLDADGVHIPTAGPHGTIPLTVPTGTTGAAITGFQAYDGSPASYGGALSGWTNATSTTAAVTTPINVGFKLVPGAPGVPAAAPTAVSGNAQVTLTWPNVNAGGSAITGYLVTPTATVGGVATVLPDVTLLPTAVTVGATTTSATITGLTNGTSYTFTVRATNAYGTGLPSLASAAVVPATVPAAPAAPTGNIGDQSITVSWTAPSTGGSAITSYTVTPYVNGTAKPALAQTTAPVTAPATPATSLLIPGLANGTAYTFTVKATNSVGTGLESAQSAQYTPHVVPSAPLGVSVTAGDRKATLSWSTPLNDGGYQITGYVITPYANGVAQTVWGTGPSTLSTDIVGLTNGTNYTFTVAATFTDDQNRTQTGTQSAATAAVVPSGAPGVSFAKLASTVSPVTTAAKVTFAWTGAPNGSPITGYHVYVRRAALGKAVPSSWGKAFTITTAPSVRIVVKPGETLYVAVVAYSANGLSSGVATSAVVTSLLPASKTTLSKGGWKKYKGSTYQSAALNATSVAGSVAKVRRVYVQAATGVGFGSATVWIGKTKITTLSLGVKTKSKASSAKLFTIKLTAKQTASLKGALVVKVAKSGKLVRLLAIGAQR